MKICERSTIACAISDAPSKYTRGISTFLAVRICKLTSHRHIELNALHRHTPVVGLVTLVAQWTCMHTLVLKPQVVAIA